MHGPTCIFWANLTTFSLPVGEWRSQASVAGAMHPGYLGGAMLARVNDAGLGKGVLHFGGVAFPPGSLTGMGESNETRFWPASACKSDDDDGPGAGSAATAPCHIYWANSPAGPNQTALVAGANFPADPVLLVSLDSSQSSRPAVAIAPLQVTASSVKAVKAVMAVLPPGLELWAYSVKVCTKADHTDCSNALAVNKADVWWFAGDGGNTSSAGGWLRLFGTSLDFTGYESRNTGAGGRAALAEERLQHALRSKDHAAITRHAAEIASLLGGNMGDEEHPDDGSRGGTELRLQLLGPSAAPIVLPAVNASMWHATFAIPSDVRPGTYSLSARNCPRPPGAVKRP